MTHRRDADVELRVRRPRTTPLAAGAQADVSAGTRAPAPRALRRRGPTLGQILQAIGRSAQIVGLTATRPELAQRVIEQGLLQQKQDRMARQLQVMQQIKEIGRTDPDAARGFLHEFSQEALEPEVIQAVSQFGEELHTRQIAAEATSGLSGLQLRTFNHLIQKGMSPKDAIQLAQMAKEPPPFTAPAAGATRMIWNPKTRRYDPVRIAPITEAGFELTTAVQTQIATAAFALKMDPIPLLKAFRSKDPNVREAASAKVNAGLLVAAQKAEAPPAIKDALMENILATQLFRNPERTLRIALGETSATPVEVQNAQYDLGEARRLAETVRVTRAANQARAVRDEAPLSPTIQKRKQALERFLFNMQEMKRNFNPAYVGRFFNSAGGGQLWRNLRIYFDNPAPGEVAFRTQGRRSAEEWTHALSGAQVSQQEFERKMQLLPKMTDAPGVFMDKLNFSIAQAERDLRQLEREAAATVGEVRRRVQPRQGLQTRSTESLLRELER